MIGAKVMDLVIFFGMAAMMGIGGEDIDGGDESVSDEIIVDKSSSSWALLVSYRLT
jgi:hypothetical protein